MELGNSAKAIQLKNPRSFFRTLIAIIPVLFECYGPVGRVRGS